MGRGLVRRSGRWTRRRRRRRRRRRCAMRGGSSAHGVVVHQRARRRRSCARCSRDVDEVLEAAEPVVMRLSCGAVAEELRGHEQRGVWAGRWTPKSGGALALGRMRGLSVLAVPVVDVFVVAVIVVAVIVLGVLHARLNSVAPRGAAGTGTAAGVGGVGSGLGGRGR